MGIRKENIMSVQNLKSILVVDAITCAGIFLLSLIAAAPVAALLGLPAIVVTLAGWICLASAALMAFVATQKTPNAALTKLIVIGNIGWVAASFAVLAAFAGQMTGLGVALVIAQALAVLVFAFLEAKGAGAVGRVAAIS